MLQLSTSLKITEETLEVLRAENDTLRRNSATREKELLTNLSDRERKLSEARNQEDKAKAEQGERARFAEKAKYWICYPKTRRFSHHSSS